MKNKYQSYRYLPILQLIVSAVVAVCIFLGLQQISYAAPASDLVNKINGWSGGGSGALSAAQNGNTVTVSGAVTGATATLALDIDPDVTVLWEASYTGTHKDQLLQLTNNGTFEIISGGSIRSEYAGKVINSADAGSTIKISGGQLSTPGNIGFGILTKGNVIMTEGEISTYSKAIEAANVDIRGGKITVTNVSNSFGYGITATGNVNMSGGDITAHRPIKASGNLQFSEGTLTSATGYGVDIGGNFGMTSGKIWAYTTAVYVNGDVEISGGEITSSTGVSYAIQSSGNGANINISGTAKIHAEESNYGIGIAGMNSALNISGGEISSTSYATVVTGSTNTTVSISGGKIWCESGNVLSISGTSTAIISGGEISISNSGSAVSVATDATATLTGAGKITATNNASGVTVMGKLYMDGGEISVFAGNGVNVSRATSIFKITAGKITTASGRGISATLTGTNITVDGGEITAGTGIGVNAGANSSSAFINGGRISVTTGDAVYSTLKSTILGGEVSTETGNAIRSTGSVEVGGTAKVRATGNGGTAISAGGGVTVTGGEVMVTTGRAISATGVGSNVVVSGGRVLAMGESSRAIYTIQPEASVNVSNHGVVFGRGYDMSTVVEPASGPFAGPVDNGVVIAWEYPGMAEYVEGTSDDLTPYPAVASATWHNDDVLGGGVSYQKDANSGFIPLDVTITSAVAPHIMNYTVHYNPNTTESTSVVSADQAYDEGAVVEIAQGIGRTGYTFMGWNTMADGNGSMFQPSDRFTMPDFDVVFYAQWAIYSQPAKVSGSRLPSEFAIPTEPVEPIQIEEQAVPQTGYNNDGIIWWIIGLLIYFSGLGLCFVSPMKKEENKN